MSTSSERQCVCVCDNFMQPLLLSLLLNSGQAVAVAGLACTECHVMLYTTSLHILLSNSSSSACLPLHKQQYYVHIGIQRAQVARQSSSLYFESNTPRPFLLEQPKSAKQRFDFKYFYIFIGGRIKYKGNVHYIVYVFLFLIIRVLTYVSILKMPVYLKDS